MGQGPSDSRPVRAGRYAAIDIGTVTCRMLVADIDGQGRLRELDREYEITNLGEGVDATGMLDPRAMERVAAAVGRYRRVLDSLSPAGSPPIQVTAMATSAARDAGNADEFAALLARLGVELAVIPGQKEAALSFKGASSDFPGERLFVVDIGGGSTEVVAVRRVASLCAPARQHRMPACDRALLRRRSAERGRAGRRARLGASGDGSVLRRAARLGVFGRSAGGGCGHGDHGRLRPRAHGSLRLGRACTARR